MKKIVLLISIFSLISCQEDELPKANFDLEAVKIFNALTGHEKVNLTWESPEDKTPNAYRIKSTSADIQIDIDADTTSYEIKGLKNGENYDFTVQAIYGQNKISGAAEAFATPIDELNFVALPGNQQIFASWNFPNRNDIVDYTIKWEGQSIDLDNTTNSYQINGLENGVSYEIELIINYNDGSTSNSVFSSATPGEVQPFILNDDSPQSNTQVIFNYNPAFFPQSTAVSWSWDFGDGSSSNEQNPTHSYSETGVYSVSVTITDEQGLSSTGTKDVYVWGVKWIYDIGSSIKPQIPTIAEDGTIYIGSEDNANFHAINPDGTLKWTYTGLSDNVYSSASIGADGTIYVGSKDDKLHAINPSNGSQIWTFDMGGDAIYSSPAIASDGTIYISSDSDNFFAVNPDGTQKWVFNTAGSNIRSTPAIASNGTVYIASDDQNLYAVNPTNGNMIWSYSLGGDVEGGIAIDLDNSIIVSVADEVNGTGLVHAINPDGSQKWVSNFGGRALSSPTIANNTIYVGTKDINQLIAIDASSGSQIWSFTANDIILSTPTVDINGNIYFGSFDDKIYVLNPDGTLKYSYLTEGNVWSSAVIGQDGTVYIGGYDGKLYAFEFFAEALADDVWPMFGKNLKHTSNNQ